jgi:hypothetical protein
VVERSARLLRDRGVASCVGDRRQIAERAVRPFGVVVAAPLLEGDASVSERGEQCLVQQLVAQPPVEALDEGVLGRLAG